MHIIIIFSSFSEEKNLNGSEMDKIWKQKDRLAKRAEEGKKNTIKNIWIPTTQLFIWFIMWNFMF